MNYDRNPPDRALEHHLFHELRPQRPGQPLAPGVRLFHELRLRRDFLPKATRRASLLARRPQRPGRTGPSPLARRPQECPRAQSSVLPRTSGVTAGTEAPDQAEQDRHYWHGGPRPGRTGPSLLARRASRLSAHPVFRASEDTPGRLGRCGRSSWNKPIQPFCLQSWS